MTSTEACVSPAAGHATAEERLAHLRHAIEHATHFLPTQGPIRVFIHHNTLHAFEDESFCDAVEHAQDVFGCEPYRSEEWYHEKLAQGRIQQVDLAAVLLQELGDNASQLVGALGTRYHLRAAMLDHPLLVANDSELNWLLFESDLLTKFRPDVDPGLKARMLAETRHWIMRDFRDPDADSHVPADLRTIVKGLFKQFGGKNVEDWSDSTWEAFTLNFLWAICNRTVKNATGLVEPKQLPVRHRDALKAVHGIDVDQPINDLLIKFCAAFLDQGISHWVLPDRDEGFLTSFTKLYGTSSPVDRWLRGVPAELRRLRDSHASALESIEDSLQQLGVAEDEQDGYLRRSLLALRGWAGMLWQMETNAEWTVHPAPRGTLNEYLAVRLLLKRVALAHYARELGEDPKDLGGFRRRLWEQMPHKSFRLTPRQRAFMVFQLAQSRGWKPEELTKLHKSEIKILVEEIELFDNVERRRYYHLAYERRYRNQTLDAFINHQGRSLSPPEQPRFQISTCIDDREESFKRHLEEIAPDCETFGYAGFYGVAMYYRGAADAHYTPLCPVVVKPQHYVQEEVVYSFGESHRRRTATRRAIGKTSHWLHTGSRSFIGGAIMALAGTLASVPLVLQVLFPRLTAKMNQLFGSVVKPPPITRLLIERSEPTPGPNDGNRGYSVEEMTNIGERVLRDIGLTKNFARIVILTGHGSSCLNNPHESAYDCGACGGGRGGPNGRAIAMMLNDPRVRERLEARGLIVPKKTFFIGAYHNTCNDDVEYFDLDRLPSSHHADFEYATQCIDQARARDAHERCRRFESAELSMDRDASLRHVEARAEDISQVRPECGHATNAVTYVGRRQRTKGLFLDRRTFLTSYDPTQDNDDAQILERILQAVIPVCAGISLEYYFSYVDSAGYGCGTKLPHNIVSLLGVMDGAASDLRTGLPWQMVEIHEPIRNLFILETTPAQFLGILQRNPMLDKLVRNKWVQIAILDPHSSAIQLLNDGKFELYLRESHELPIVKSSIEWYRGWRDHLGYASIIPEPSTNGSARSTAKKESVNDA